MSSNLHKASKCYGVFNETNKIVAFIGILHFPHPVVKNMKKVSRLVVLPDYQGIGIGKKFLDSIADIYTKKGYDFRITTSVKNLIHSLNKDDKWILKNYGRMSNKSSNNSYNGYNKTNSSKRKTASFKYTGGD